MNSRLFVLAMFLIGLLTFGNSGPPATGYANITLTRGYRLIANNFYGDATRVAQFLSDAAEGTEFYKLVGGDFTTNIFSAGTWSDPDQTLEPGEGAIVLNPSLKNYNATFRGQVPQGRLINHIPAGLSLKSSLVPQVGGLTTDLGLRLSPFDNVYLLRTNRCQVYTFLPDGTWTPSEPRVSVGESFFVRVAQDVDWVRTFSINQ